MTFSLRSTLLILLMSPSAFAYLDAPAEKLTLPQLVKEFKSIEVVEVQAFDLEKGTVSWKRVEQLQGSTKAAPIRHLLRLRGKVPEALRRLEVGQRAVCFSADGWDRGLIRIDGCWYVTGFEAESGWWRIAFTDLWYDFNLAYAGDTDELITAIKKLLAGEPVAVRCRIKAKEEALQSVRYDMKRPNEKQPAPSPATRPATRPAR